MTALQKMEALLPKMTPDEKEQLRIWLISDLTNSFPGIEKTPGVCGGDACIIRTRIPVWSVVRRIQMGFLDEEQLTSFPSLRKEDLHHARNYYRINKKEIDKQILENEEDE